SGWRGHGPHLDQQAQHTAWEKRSMTRSPRKCKMVIPGSAMAVLLTRVTAPVPDSDHPRDVHLCRPPMAGRRAPASTVLPSGAAARDPPVVVCDVISCLLRSERPCEFVRAVLHRCIERIV